ncbi:hypothetical protein RHMOL_Rhmol06G0085300 [Rhododendron molle]|uniref:Uncharacterized protein n=1 Tax=Rhododendron molle TaxID=49168 RepID=A0ACC0NBT4_RHOML|nr:hypothetical protein RHMOL_Rhmol06G0085300 [Rhododendron molle]
MRVSISPLNPFRGHRRQVLYASLLLIAGAKKPIVTITACSSSSGGGGGNNPGAFTTIKERVTFEREIKKSKFITVAGPISDEGSAHYFLSEASTSRGQKRPRTEEVSKAKGRTMTNPYIIFKEEFVQGVREAEPYTKYILKTLTKRAAKRWKEMPEADKAPYIRSANEEKAKKPKEQRKTTVPIFRSRCSPNKLGELNKKLTNNQRKAVQRLGFGSLLNVQCNMLPWDFTWKLVEHFNPKTRTLEFGRLRTYEVTTADVARALGLKLGGVPVPTNCEDDHVKHIESLFLEKGKKLTRGLTVKMMDYVFDKKTSGKSLKLLTFFTPCVASFVLRQMMKQAQSYFRVLWIWMQFQIMHGLSLFLTGWFVKLGCTRTEVQRPQKSRED